MVTPGSGITTFDVLREVKCKAAEEYRSMLPPKMRGREIAVAGFQDGMSAMLRHLVHMEIIAIRSDK